MKVVFFRDEQIQNGYHRPTRPVMAHLLGSAFFSIESIERKSPSTALVSYCLNREQLGRDGEDLRQRMLNHIEHIVAMWEDNFNSPFVILTGALFDLLSFLDGHTVMGEAKLFFLEPDSQQWLLLNPDNDLQAQFASQLYGEPVSQYRPETNATPVLKSLIGFLKENCASHEKNPKGERRFAERMFQHFFDSLPHWRVQFVALEQNLSLR